MLFRSDDVSNTEAYISLIGREVGRVIKDFGAGTGLSDADREYANKIAGGDITITKDGLRRILSIAKKVNNELITRHNRDIDNFSDKALEALPYRPEARKIFAKKLKKVPQEIVNQAKQKLAEPGTTVTPAMIKLDLAMKGYDISKVGF